MNNPIAIFAFKRIDPLRKTLDALQRCDGFEEASVHVFSDAPRSAEHGEDDDVASVRSFLRKWCADVGGTLHEADANKGLRPSIVGGVSTILSQFDRVIVLEDDIIVARTFLNFMNEALGRFENRNDVVQISANMVPHKRKLPAIGLLRVPTCWGWATWRRAWNLYNDDATVLLKEIAKSDSTGFNLHGAYDYFGALRANADGSLNTWFVRWYASVFLAGGLTVYPAQTLTRNIGFDESGTNCRPSSTSKVYTEQRLSQQPKSIDWNSIGHGESAAYLSTVEEFLRWEQRQWTKPSLRDRVKARVDLLLRVRASE